MKPIHVVEHGIAASGRGKSTHDGGQVVKS